MKKLSPYLLSIVVIGYLALVITSLISCSKDDGPALQEEEILKETPPTLTLESGSKDVQLGIIGSPENGVLTHSIKAVAPDGFKSLVISKVVDGNETEYETIDTNHPNYNANSNTQIYNLNYNLKEKDLNHKLNFKAVVTDVNNKTYTLDFAQARAEMQMIKTTITLSNIVPYNNSDTIPFYLYINGNSIASIGYNGVKDSGKSIAAVFSYNKYDGFYLSSPYITIPKDIVQNFDHRSTTKFKRAKNEPYELALDSEYGIFDAHNVISKFDELDFNANEQKATGVDNGPMRYFFRTDDNRTGVFQVKKYLNIGVDSHLEIDILVTDVVKV